jgi:cathepsin L
LEGGYAKKYNKMVILSQQFLVDCAWNGNMGCDGGMQNLAYQYIQEVGGIPSTVDYGEYKMINEMCHYNNKTPTAQVSGFVSVPTGDEAALVQASASAGPIAISIDASHMSFVFYYSGVYYEPACQNGPDDLDHAVLLIGYGTEDGQDYWLVKNSWSTFWGDFGYVKMARNRNNNCGVATGALYPIVV